MNQQIVLLVEDEETDAEMAMRSIRRSGLDCKVIWARTGDEAIQLCKEQASSYSLIFLDIKLPRVNGFEVLQSIRQSPSMVCTPVVMLSSSDEAGDVERAVSLGANSYIRKQLDPEISDANLKLALGYWLMVDGYSRAARTIHSRVKILTRP